MGETYHISGYDLISIRDLTEMILDKLGKRFEDCVEIGPERPGKDHGLHARQLQDPHRTGLAGQDRPLRRCGRMHCAGPAASKASLQSCRRSYVHKA